MPMFNAQVFGSDTIDATISYTDDSVINGGGTTYSSQAIGAAGANRHVIVCFTIRGVSAGITSVNSCTIGGVSATKVVELATSGTDVVSMWIAAVSTGTTANVVFTPNGGSPDRSILGVWAAYDLQSATATDTVTSIADPASLTLNISAGGVAVGMNWSQAGTSTTWSNLTENFDTQVIGVNTASGASGAFATAQTSRAITADYASAVNVGAVGAAFR